jgi:hypothetical protein
MKYKVYKLVHRKVFIYLHVADANTESCFVNKLQKIRSVVLLLPRRPLRVSVACFFFKSESVTNAQPSSTVSVHH